MAAQKDITGQRFRRLVALSYDRVKRQWECMCDCGTRCYRTLTSLQGGHIVSCGCYRRTRIQPSTTHGRTHTPEYRSWRAMKRRCLNPNASQYAYYGGRGITVCERWLKFDNFFADMGEKPSADHSLERQENDGPYSPGNCVWATRSMQVTNRRPAPPRDCVCVVCGGTFTARSPKAKFCSVAHSSTFYRERRRHRGLPPHTAPHMP